MEYRETDVSDTDVQARAAVIRKGTVVRNIKTGKRYIALGVPWERENGPRISVSRIDGKGHHYMEVANITIDPDAAVH